MTSTINECPPRECYRPSGHPITPEKLWEQPQLVAGVGLEVDERRAL